MDLPRIVVDTNVFVGALVRHKGHNRELLQAVFEGKFLPLMGQALFFEYEQTLGRNELFRKSPLSAAERQQLFAAFLSICEWVQVYFLWRPNLWDESDNHVFELAVAGGAIAIATNNVADFRGCELRFPSIRIARPEELLEELS